MGDPRSKGAKLGKPGVLAVGAVWRRSGCYGRTESVYLAVVACIWYGSFGNTPRRRLLVQETNSTKAYDLALFTFDAQTGPAKVVARYAVRWSIEPSNATGKHRPPATGHRATRMARDRGVPWPGPLRSWRAGVKHLPRAALASPIGSGDRPWRRWRDSRGPVVSILRGEMHRWMLANGYCAGPVEMDCHSSRSASPARPSLLPSRSAHPAGQRDDAENKGQVAQQRIFDGRLTRLDDQAS